MCCFLPKVLLPLRRVWSECLLGVLRRDSRKTKHHSFDQKVTNQIRIEDHYKPTTHREMSAKTVLYILEPKKKQPN